MHLVGTNICVWIRTLGKETLVELNDHLKLPTDCENDEIISNILESVSPYLYPFIVEYSLIGAAFLYVMWSNIGRRYSVNANGSIVPHNDTQSNVLSMGATSGFNDNMSTASSFSLPSLYSCLGSSKGEL